MTHAVRRLAVLLVLVASLAAPSFAWAVPIDGSVPAIPASPVTVSLPEGDSQVYRVSLAVGDTLSLSLSPSAGMPADLDFDLYLYGPGATETNHGAPLRLSKQPATAYPEAFSYVAPAAGEYYVEVYCYEGTGSGVLTWQVVPEVPLPVYRFYNVRTGTHFYTPDEAERANVQATMGAVFQFEGVAYYMRPSRNTQYLYRFYNRRNGSHFYTASDAERDSVINNLGAVYSFDGPTYLVSPTPDAGKIAVHRFYNRRNGSHFYTASDIERDTVINNLGWLYSYEGPAFYVGQ